MSTTASRAIWIVRQASELTATIDELEQQRAFEDAVLCQQYIDAPVEHAQAVFSEGRLLGMHSYRQIVRGAGGGDAVKESAYRPIVREHLSRLGAHLNWHGALSIDYLVPEPANTLYYIDCNPRLVEPVNAALAGADLLALLLQVSLNQDPQPLKIGRDGVRSHMGLQALLGCAIRTHSRLELAREWWRLVSKRGIYSDSQEELTPLRWDWPSVIPTLIAAIWLLIIPGAAKNMHKKGWGTHLLNAASVRITRGRIGTPVLPE